MKSKLVLLHANSDRLNLFFQENNIEVFRMRRQ